MIKVFIQDQEKQGMKNALLSVKNLDPCPSNPIDTLSESDYAEIEKEIQDCVSKREIALLDTVKKMESHNQQFDEALEEAKRNSPFEYYVTGLSAIKGDMGIFDQKKTHCPNRETKILFHGTQERVVNSILETHFLNGKDFYAGIGTYFSEMVDIAAIYNVADSKNAALSILPVGKTFEFVACEIYYDKSKFIHVKDDSMRYMGSLNNKSRDEIRAE